MQSLRVAGTLVNKVHANTIEIEQLKDSLVTYFNHFALFFPSAVNITVRTMVYAKLFHASLLYNRYKVSLGILSLQAKESKHTCLKNYLALTNRSRSTGSLGK